MESSNRLTPRPSFPLCASQTKSTFKNLIFSAIEHSPWPPTWSPCFHSPHPRLPTQPAQTSSQCDYSKCKSGLLSLSSLNPKRAPTALRLDSETLTKGHGASPVWPWPTSSSGAAAPSFHASRKSCAHHLGLPGAMLLSCPSPLHVLSVYPVGHIWEALPDFLRHQDTPVMSSDIL